MTATEATFRPLAIVTGASSGIGLALARELAEHDFDLIIAAEDPAIADAATTLRTTGANVQPVVADLAIDEGVDKLVTSAASDGRAIAALVINAGVGVAGPFVDTDLQEHLDLVELNVTGAVKLAGRLLPGMAARGEGRVLFTSSIAATMPGPYMSTTSSPVRSRTRCRSPRRRSCPTPRWPRRTPR
jgi:uncharacterized protein